MKSRVEKIATATLLLALLGAAPFHSGAQQRHTKGRALLVGVNYYQHAPDVPPTRGAQEDAEATSELIQQKYGFQRGEIKLLLGAQATAGNIIAEFRRWLIEGTQPGDRVFFHYSGHGSRVKDLNGDEADGYDETLAPYDVTLSGENMINDDELGELIAQLSGRLAVLVFDSCHSGTISRAVGGGKNAASDARYLPSPEEFKQLKLAGARGAGYVGYEARDQSYPAGGERILRRRDFKLVDEHSVGPATGVVVISAAGAGQVAHALEVNGGKRGALSYVFGEAHESRVLTLRKLREEIAGRINALHQSGRLKGSQQPAFEIISTVPLEDQPLFGDWTSAPEVALNNPQSRIKLSLRALQGKTEYKLGEKISYEFRTDTAGYLYLLVFSEGNRAGCIFPNNEAAENQDNYVTAGTHRVPRARSFYAQEPVGKDVVIALLSSEKLNLVYGEDYSWSGIFDRLRSKKFFDYVTTRGQTAKKPQSGATLDQVEWQAASLVLYTVR